jgi:hypothetical protein
VVVDAGDGRGGVGLDEVGGVEPIEASFVPEPRHRHEDGLAGVEGGASDRKLRGVGVGLERLRRDPLVEAGQSLGGGVGTGEVRDTTVWRERKAGFTARFEGVPDALAERFFVHRSGHSDDVARGGVRPDIGAQVDVLDELDEVGQLREGVDGDFDTGVASDDVGVDDECDLLVEPATHLAETFEFPHVDHVIHTAV